LSVFIFLLVFVPLSLLIASRISEREDKQFLQSRVLLAWLLLGSLVAIVNEWMPFTVLAADDFSYFNSADPPIKSFSEALNFNRFMDLYNQPGYPWLLSLLNSLTGHDLLTYKYLNLFFLILLALAWYRIGLILDSRRFGRRLMVSVLLLTPLWYYVFFLLKDISIALLQSVFLLAVVRIMQTSKFRPVLMAIFTTFALLPMRTALMVQNGVVLFGTLGTNLLSKGSQKAGLRFILISIAILIPLIFLINNQAALIQFGLFTEDRLLNSKSLEDLAYRHSKKVTVDPILFPIQYLLLETSGLSYKSYSEFDSKWLRGVLALPWIFYIVPFFFLGLRWLFQIPKGVKPANSIMAKFLQKRLATTPWIALFIFILISIYISWTVGDTTRWRIADLPMITAIALSGWQNTRPKLRSQLFIVWISSIILSFIFFNILRG
jgi:hypothetical protein